MTKTTKPNTEKKCPKCLAQACRCDCEDCYVGLHDYHCQPTMPNTPKTKEDILERIKTARTCILAFRALMQVQTTDNSEGDKFDAVPITMVNQWFDILEKQIPESLDLYAESVREAEREKTLKEVNSIMVDWAWRKYPPRHILKEVAKFINAQLKKQS